MILFSALTYSRYECQHTQYVTSNRVAQLRTRQIYHKTTRPYLHVLIFIFFHHFIAWYLPDIACIVFYCNFSAFGSPAGKIIHLSIGIEAQRWQCTESELTDCWSIKTAKNEAPPPSTFSVDTARAPNAAGTSEKRKCNCNITVCKY